MTHDQPITHAEFREQIAAVLAGGLSAAERSAFEAHAGSCAACAAEWSAAREAEERMVAMFAGQMPLAGFEDRIIQRLRCGRAGWRRANWVHPAVRKAVTGVAAMILLGGFGYVASQIVDGQRGGSELATASAGSETPATPAAPAAGFSLIRRGLSRAEDLGTQPSDGSALADEAGQQAESESLDRYGGYRYYSQLPSLDGAQPDEDAMDVGGKNVSRAQGQGAARGGGGGGGGGSGPRGTQETWDLAGGDKPQRTDVVLPAEGQVTARTTSAGTDWFKPAELGRAVAGKEYGVQVGQALKFTPSSGEWSRAGSLIQTVDGKRPQSAARQLDVSGVALQTAPADPQPVPARTPAPTPAPPSAGQSGEPPAPAPPPPPAPTNPAAAAPENPPAASRATTRKIIRNGIVQFEVDRFDSAFAQVVKLTQEAGGYVGTTDSEKLPNGKVKGTITVRVPPDRLDTLVLQLRGIGDLKSQKLEAQDVSKRYSDLDSELRAARAMEERLLAIIKEGKGQIKDLLAAEKELGNWRTKIETITGELRYFDNLVAMSTLHITLLERDIATAASAIETETIDAGVESQDVEKARAEALKAIEEAKGRVIQSDLKRYDAGQFGATIVAEVPPDRAGALLDRIRQIGKVARLDVQRKQTTPEGGSSTRSGATNPPMRVERRDTRLNLSLYNLANVAPRQTTVTTIAADDVEQAYRAILERVARAGGRIVTSSVVRSKPEQTTGTIAFEVPSADAEAVASDVRAAGEVTKLSVTENPDVQNATTAKRGFNVLLVSMASVAPRETITMQLAATDVRAARDAILLAATAPAPDSGDPAAGGTGEAGGAGARVLASQLSETDRQNASAKLDLDVKRSALPALEKALADAGQAISRKSTRSTDTENTLDSKVRLTLTVVTAEQIPPRETTTMSVELRDVESASGTLQAAAQQAGGRIVESSLSKDREGRSQAKLVIEVPLDKAGKIIAQARQLGAVRAIDASRNLQVEPGKLARARVELTLGNADAIVAPERGLWASIRRGLATSLAGLAWSAQLIVIGLCFVLPWALILWAGWKWMTRRSRNAAPAAAS